MKHTNEKLYKQCMEAILSEVESSVRMKGSSDVNNEETRESIMAKIVSGT